MAARVGRTLTSMATAITQQQLALGLNTITFPTLAAFLSRQFSPCAHRRSALSIYSGLFSKKKIEFHYTDTHI
jgi:hypothetical protein